MAALLHAGHDGEAAMASIAQLTSIGADVDAGLRCRQFVLPLTVPLTEIARPARWSLLVLRSQSCLVAEWALVH